MALFASPAARAQFSDNTFPNSSWQTILLPSSVSGSTCTAAQNLTAGNPSPSRETTHSYPVGSVNCAHVLSAAIHDPVTQGAITGLRYSYDLRYYSAATVPGSVRYSPLIVQNGTYYYILPGDSAALNGWVQFPGASQTLTAADFVKLEGPSTEAHPDFSCRGARMQFGYVTRNHLPSGTHTITTRSGLDNWQITIDTEPCEVQISCPDGWTPTSAGGVTYCCPEDVAPNATEFCCIRACPPGSITQVVNGVVFCCQVDARGELCCTRMSP